MLILIVGLGSIAIKHIHAIRAIDKNATIYALRSSRASLLFDGIINLYTEVEIPEVLDFAIVSNPTNMHFETIEKLTALGVPLFIEKPPLNSLGRSESLVKLLDERKITTYIACNLRFHPCIEFIKEYLQTNDSRINEVNVYCGSYLPDWRPGKNFRDIYSTSEALGGGVHLDLYHEMDNSVWLFGMPYSNKGYRSSESSLGIDSSDYANYLLNYNGFNLSIILNYYRRQPKRSIEIVFEDSTITVDLIANKVLTDIGEIIFAAKEYTLMNSYVDQMGYFIGCLKSDIKPMNDFNEALEILKLCLRNESVS
ncbi:MAG: Gfo/Idh/MocA family oxidoreductase [Bacteroidetes bacterium]|nr:Gfo/Idh/MocA family oxidoreductase [Bacteroidota bacterium]